MNITFNPENISVYIWVAVAGFVFSVFSLMYNVQFIYVGFITFVYGLVMHIFVSWLGWFVQSGYSCEKKFIFVVEIIGVAVWIYINVKLLNGL